MTKVLHPALQAMVDATIAAGTPPLDELNLEQARALGPEWGRPLSGDGPEVARVADVSISVRHGTVPGRLFIPHGPLQALVVYFHGGGWVLGDIFTYDPIARLVATEMGCALLLVDYRLAPEHPFPAGVEDCVDALRWAAEHGEALTGQALPLVVMGDSGGGNLAAVTAQLTRSDGPVIAAQVLVVPNIDAIPATESYREIWDFPLFGGRSMEWFWSKYQPDPDKRLVPEISPIRATSLAGLPPAIVITAEFDPLRDEGRAYVEAMRAAGVTVAHYFLDSLNHGFLNFGAVFDAPSRVMARAGKDLGRLLAGETPEDLTFSAL